MRLTIDQMYQGPDATIIPLNPPQTGPSNPTQCCYPMLVSHPIPLPRLLPTRPHRRITIRLPLFSGRMTRCGVRGTPSGEVFPCLRHHRNQRPPRKGKGTRNEGWGGIGDRRTSSSTPFAADEGLGSLLNAASVWATSSVYARSC